MNIYIQRKYKHDEITMRLCLILGQLTIQQTLAIFYPNKIIRELLFRRKSINPKFCHLSHAYARFEQEYPLITLVTAY